LSAAPSAIDAVVQEARAAYSGAGLAGLVKIVEAIRPLLLAVKDPLARDVYIEGAAKQLGIDGRVLRQHLGGRPLVQAGASSGARPAGQQASRPAPAASRPEKPGETPKPRVELDPPKVELAVLKLAVEQPELTMPALEANDVLSAFTHPALKAAIEAGRGAWRGRAPFDAHRAIEAARASGAGEKTMRALRETLIQALPEQEPLETCIEHLLLNYYQHRLRELRGQQGQQSDPEAEARLDAELAEVVRAKAALVQGRKRGPTQNAKRA
jgi:DNA primase